ncbi:MAG TPA: TaqI-like C-terminal specificity domain-containing protein [Sphingobacteriaceae bacterium]|nr:TaqI-like C-terminal specificity domain-containing protein [Sphingobacteriaceae bacterium]
MIPNFRRPKQALNKAFLKVKPNRTEIEGFKSNLIKLIDRINESESEEFHKNLIIDFLKAKYDPHYYINTKGRNDLVVHNADKASSNVGVIIETKKPTNKSEMLTVDNVNYKAFQELVLYYLRERITHKNLELKHLIVSNINEWFIFDAQIFERFFAQNKGLVKQFEDFEAGRLADIKTEFFYRNIAQPEIEKIKSQLEFTYFDIKDYEKPLRNADKKDDAKLIALYKLFSPEHLLKLPFANDSNSLDKRFYSELLHIIGLTETKEGGTKLIGRNPIGSRHSGSILEDAIIQLDSLDKISQLEKPSQYGNSHEERLFNVGLELSITWINRVLFLKLLEAQLITYHKGDKSYAFLNKQHIRDWDELNSLFFQVLAKKHEERNEDVRLIFEKVPYLNSSLFEPTEMEQKTVMINFLKNEKTVPVISSTVLKNRQGKKFTGSLNTLEYLFKFLDAYDFASEASEEIQEENKTLINASVLGLIFEKINGYKDGSFFTPGFITMYMCRESIRRTVVQKFNEAKGWEVENIDQLYDKIEDRTAANDLINSIKICDPAVGSGHFLVSALNEIISIKNDLKILQDRSGKRLKEYHIEVTNDELIVTDEDGELFEYNPNNKESQRIQETLFHEKQTIIENCLFGVDINPNSVKICRLRLWIELLKSAYYKEEALQGFRTLGGLATRQLETLPNIDINIKCGNSLVSRFGLEEDLKQALKKSKFSIDAYRVAVARYRNADNKEEKREMERLIKAIKSDFRTEIAKNDKKIIRKAALGGELYNLTMQTGLFEESAKEKKIRLAKIAKISTDLNKLEAEIETIKANQIFENAFEWRFEFPEILNDEGDFVGFDMVIGNPPYVPSRNLDKREIKLLQSQYITSEYQINTSALFCERGFQLLKHDGILTYIIPNYWLSTQYDKSLRNLVFIENHTTELANVYSVFDSAVVDTLILISSKGSQSTKSTTIKSIGSKLDSIEERLAAVSRNEWEYLENIYLNKDNINSISFQNGINIKGEAKLGDFFDFRFGVKLYQIGKGHPSQNNETIKSRAFEADCKIDETFYPYLRARDVQKFKVLDPVKFIKYGKHLAEPRDISLFQGNRILVQRIVGRKSLLAAFTNMEMICSSDVITLKPLSSGINLYFILGVLNSKLCLKVLKTINVNLDRSAYPKINTKTLESFPLIFNPNIESEIARLVKDLTLSNNNKDKNAILEIEDKINQLVYELYDLTEEEIGIVEEGGR